VIVVLVVFYAGILLFLMTGWPSPDDLKKLRLIARWVLIASVAASAVLIFVGARMFSAGPIEEGVEGALDEEELLLEEYLGLSDEEAREEAEAGEEEEDSEVGHA
jgi:hypothetical protein